jgi:hypothetical protein
VLILGLVYFKATSELVHESLEFPDFQLVFQFFVSDHPEIGIQFWLVFYLSNPLHVFVIEFEIAIHYLLEKHLVVLHEGVKPGFCIECDIFWVSGVGDFLSEPVYDLIESFEMGNILTDEGFGISVSSFFHEIEEGLLIVGDGLPGGP